MKRSIACLLLQILAAAAVTAAEPPSLVNYQGVLRNASDHPLTGSHDMVFRFYTAPAGGEEILVDRHTTPDGNPVVVTGGLFNVPLGSGIVVDGAGAGSYGSLAEVFRDYATVHLEVQVGGEVLAPRVRVVSAAYALNADHLDGLNGSQLLRSDAADSYTSGTLTLDPGTALDVHGALRINGAAVTSDAGEINKLDGAGATVTAGNLTTLTNGSAADALHTHTLVPNADKLDGNDSTFFLNTSAAAQAKTGSLTVSTLTLSANAVLFAAGPQLGGSAAALTVTAGTDNTDVLILQGGNSTDDGSVFIAGDATFDLTSGNGDFRFFNGSTGTSTAHLDSSGTLQIDGFLDVDGNNVLFQAGGSIISAAASFNINAGDADTDVMAIAAGNSPDDGRLLILGDGNFEMHSGNGAFRFLNAGTATETASLSAAGTLQLDGDVHVDGNDLIFGAGGNVVGGATSTVVFAGDADTDNLELTAGNSFDDGRVLIVGDGKLELRSGNGVIDFANGNTNLVTGSLGTTGNLQIDGDLTVSGNTVTAPGSLTLDGGTGATIVVQSDFEVLTHLDFDATATGENADWCANGNCTGANHLMELQEDGDLRIGGVLSQNQFDLAEAYLEGEPIEPGDLVRLHPDRKGAVLLSAGEGDATVLGVVSERPGVVLGGAPFGVDALERMWGADVVERFQAEQGRRIETILAESPELAALEAGSDEERAHLAAKLESRALEEFYREHFALVALAGRVPVKVDGQFGAIAAGDPLGPSPIPGVAMKSRSDGPVIGIALESFSGGRGRVETFIARGSVGSPSVHAVERRLAGDLDERPPDPTTVNDRGSDDEAHVSVVFHGGEGRVGVAELFALSEPAQPGDVLVADRESLGRYRLATAASDAAVVGVVAGEPGVLLAPVALTGTVLVRADAGYGAIRIGDLLTTSATKGHAMRAADILPGTILGKALEPLDAGRGLIRVLVMMR